MDDTIVSAPVVAAPRALPRRRQVTRPGPQRSPRPSGPIATNPRIRPAFFPQQQVAGNIELNSRLHQNGRRQIFFHGSGMHRGYVSGAGIVYTAIYDEA
jgi:hypothetical protein